MKNIADTHYEIHSDVLTKDKNWECLMEEWKRNGFCEIMDVDPPFTTKVLSPATAVFLCMDKFSVFNNDAKENDIVDPLDYFKTFKKAFIRGFEYINREWVSKGLYNSKELIRDMHRMYYHTGYKNRGGWNFVREEKFNEGHFNGRVFLIKVNHTLMDEFGYYSGIISRVDELKIDHSHAFIGFDQCTIAQPLETKPDVKSLKETKKRGPQKGAQKKRKEVLETYKLYSDQGISHNIVMNRVKRDFKNTYSARQISRIINPSQRKKDK